MSPTAPGPRTRRVVFWCYTALLMIATHIPNSAMPQVNIRWFDKAEHLGAYGLWTLLLFLSGYIKDGPFRARAARAMGWSALIAVTDELLQMIPVLNRVADPLDIAADLLGSGCAVCAVWVWERSRKSG